MFKNLLSDKEIPSLSQKEKLDEFFLWYQMSFLDSAKSQIFNGVSSFNSLLIGEIETRKKHENKEKLEIRRIKHPVGFTKGNDYSYAILIERFGTFFSDFSGWLVFFDCCTDYSGFGGTEYADAEDALKKYKKFINVEEISIDKQFFLSSYSETTSIEELLNISRKRLDEIFGYLIVILTYSYYLQDGYKAKLHFQDKSIFRNNEELDILVKVNKELHLVECSKHVSIEKDTTDVVGEFKKKESAIIKNKKYLPKEFKKFTSTKKIFVIAKSSIRNPNRRKLLIAKLSKNNIIVYFIEDIWQNVDPKLSKEIMRFLNPFFIQDLFEY